MWLIEPFDGFLYVHTVQDWCRWKCWNGPDSSALYLQPNRQVHLNIWSVSSMENLPSPAIYLSAKLKQLQLRTKLYNPFTVRDLQPVKTYFVFSVRTTSCTATFPQLHTKTWPSAVSASVEKQNPLASFTWDRREILMWYWWKAPPRRVIDFLCLLWRISEPLVFVQRFIWNRDENLFSGDFIQDQS